MRRLTNRMKRIPWKDFFQIDNVGMVTLLITPDRTAENRGNFKLWRALHELYSSPLARLSFGRWRVTYKPKACVWYDVLITKDEIKFYFTVPSRWETYARQKIANVWPRAAIDTAEPNELRIPLENTRVSELAYKRHNIFALRVDRTEDTQPLNTIMAASRDMGDGDKARLSICVDPIHRLNWQDQAEAAHKQFAQSKTPQRRGLSKKKILQGLGHTIEGLFEQFGDLALTILGHEETKPVTTAVDLEKRQILVEGKLQTSTLSKRIEPTFNTHIRVASHSVDEQRREVTGRALAAGFGEIAGDNELEALPVKSKKATVRILCELNSHKLGSPVGPKQLIGSALAGAAVGSIAHYALPLAAKVTITKVAGIGGVGGALFSGNLALGNGDKNIMSASELGKLCQIPGAGLQDDYVDQVQTIKLRQDGPPASVCKAGIVLGHVELKTSEIAIFKPIDNPEELCLPDVDIGGMGVGKTKGQAANTAVQAVLHGFGAATIDPAKRELGKEIMSVLAPDQYIHIDLSKVKLGLDWRESFHTEHMTTRLANTILAFFNMEGTEMQTERFLFAAVVGMRTRKLGEILKIFEDDNYREQVIESMNDGINKTTLIEFGSYSPDRKRGILAPIYNRMAIIFRDQYLAECMECDEGLDFWELMQQPKVVIIDIPDDTFDPLAKDLLVNLISTKIDIAMRLRPEEKQFPYFVIMDEPHQYLRSAKLWTAAAVESRKFRVKYCWLFHSWEQIPADLAEIILSAGPHFHIYRSSEKTYKSLKHFLEPYTLEDVTKMPLFHAINIIRANLETTRPFMAKMLLPPSKQKLAAK